MKLTYQKPAYRHIALDGTTPASSCTESLTHDRFTCPIVLPDGPFVSLNVFDMSKTTSACDTDPTPEYEGAIGPNVFGS